MKFMSLLKPVLLLAILVPTFAIANPVEPAYCNPKNFAKLEISEPKPVQGKISRFHGYRIGRSVLAGMAIGNSDAQVVRQVAQSLSQATASEGYCTWYLNEGNSDAEKIFNWTYLENPSKLAQEKAVEQYLKTIGPAFQKSATSFVSCLEKNKYLGLGCNGQKHRGPSIFAMILAYSGCRPENATQIANTIWGLNGVPEETRLALAQAAYQLGQKESEASKTMQEIFSAN